MDPMTILTIVGSVLSLASLITGLTPTPVDDGIVAAIRKLIGVFSVVTPKDHPSTFKLPLTSLPK